METTLSKRLTQLLERLDLSARAFEIECDLGNGVISGAIKNNTDLSDKTIKRITSKYPYINIGWLMLGQGEMISKGELTEANSETDLAARWKQSSIFYKKRADRYEAILLALGIDIDSIDKPGAKD